MSALQVRVEERDGDTIVHLMGRAGVTEQDELERQMTRLIAMHPKSVVIDLSDLHFIGSIGMGQLTQLARNVKQRGGSIRARGARGPVRDACMRARLTDVIPFDEDASV